MKYARPENVKKLNWQKKIKRREQKKKTKEKQERIKEKKTECAHTLKQST